VREPDIKGALLATPEVDGGPFEVKAATTEFTLP